MYINEKKLIEMKLSIIIPVYNVEKYVEKCLRSCAEQDLPSDEYEIIVVNDGTKDSSLEIVERVAKDYSNIAIISQENAGLSAARNKGLSLAKGEYIWFIDSDDWIEKNCLQKIIRKCFEDGLDVLGICAANVVNDYIVRISKSIMPGSYSYFMSYQWTNTHIGYFPFPIDESKIKQPIILKDNEPIVIFHGWQKGKDSRKGNDVFDRVIKKVVKKYGEKVEYRVVQNVPFNEYIKLYSDSHIFIDQLFGFDKGMNGLLGMAAGKVVFSGFKKNTLCNYPNYKGELIGIESHNDEDYLFERFCELIDNPRLIEKISKNAIEFVKQNHLTDFVADLYINEWKKYL